MTTEQRKSAIETETKVQMVYRVTTQPLGIKLGLPTVLRRVNPSISPPQIEEALRLANQSSIRMVGRLDSLLQPTGLQLLENDSYADRLQKTTQMVEQSLQEGNAVIAIDTTHINWNKVRNKVIQKLEINRLFDKDGDLLGFGPRPNARSINEQLDVIAASCKAKGITKIALVEDVIDSGESMTRIMNLLAQRGLQVNKVILSGSIYPARKAMLEQNELKGVTIQAAMEPLDSRYQAVGGFNLADCYIGGPGNTLGQHTIRTRRGQEFQAGYVGKRIDGTPLPAGLIYGPKKTWGAFLRRTDISFQKKALEIILDENYRLWKSLETLVGQSIPLGALERFPVGLGIETTQASLASSVYLLIQNLREGGQ